MTTHSSLVRKVIFSHDGNEIASVSWDATLQIWNANTGAFLKLLRHNASINSASYSPNDLFIVSGCQDGSIYLWNILRNSCEMFQHSSYVGCVSYFKCGTRFASGGDKTICIWDVFSKKVILTLEGHKTFITCLCVSASEEFIASCSDDKSLIFWNCESGKKLHEFPTQHTVNAISNSHNGRYVIFCLDTNLCMFYLDKPSVIKKTITSNLLSDIAHSPNGQFFVTGSYDNIVTIWKIKPLEIVFELKGHILPVSSVSYSPDGKKIVSGSFDHTVRIWDAETGECLQILQKEILHNYVALH